MTGPEGNSEFCFPRISTFSETKSREILRFEGNKIHCLPMDKSLKAGSHVRRKRKRKHKEVHTSNAIASTVQYASAMEYSKMVDEVDVLVLLFFLFLGLRRIRRRRLIQRNNKSRPKRLCVRESFSTSNHRLPRRGNICRLSCFVRLSLIRASRETQRKDKTRRGDKTHQSEHT